MSRCHGKLTGVYEGFGGRGKRLYRPFFSAHENEWACGVWEVEEYFNFCLPLDGKGWGQI